MTDSFEAGLPICQAWPVVKLHWAIVCGCMPSVTLVLSNSRPLACWMKNLSLSMSANNPLASYLTVLRLNHGQARNCRGHITQYSIKHYWPTSSFEILHIKLISLPLLLRCGTWDPTIIYWSSAFISFHFATVFPLGAHEIKAHESLSLAWCQLEIKTVCVWTSTNLSSCAEYAKLVICTYIVVMCTHIACVSR